MHSKIKVKYKVILMIGFLSVLEVCPRYDDRVIDDIT